MYLSSTLYLTNRHYHHSFCDSLVHIIFLDMSVESTKEGTTVDNDVAKESSSDDSYDHYWFDVTQEFSMMTT
jgi:hypothetical protein